VSESRHGRITNRLDHGARLGSDDFVEDLEMRSDHVERNQIADALIEFGGAFEIRKQERQAGDLEPLVDIDRVGTVEIAKDLVRQQAFCGQEGFASAEKLMELISGDP